MIKALFFDFDGTISDSKKIAYESMARVLNEFGYKFNEKKLAVLMGSKIEIILKELDLKNEDSKSVRKKFYEYFTRVALGGGIKPCVSLKPLWELRKNYPLIVVSNSEEGFLKASISKLELNGLFEAIYGAGKFGKKSEMLIKLFNKIKIKPHEAIYVGDRFSDIDYAKKAKCISVAIQNKCSWSDLKTIEKMKPDYIIKNFAELKKLIQKLNRV